jgi:hypothetical protein
VSPRPQRFIHSTDGRVITQAMEWVVLIGGPCNHEPAEVPVGYPEIWRHDGGSRYWLYRRYQRTTIFRFVEDSPGLTKEQISRKMADENRSPLVHTDR